MADKSSFDPPGVSPTATPTPGRSALWALVVVLGVIAFFLGAIAVRLILPQPTARSLQALLSGRPEQPPPSAETLTLAEAAVAAGNGYFDQKRWPEAAEQYETALRRGIDNPDLRTDLGSAYRFSGDFAKAEENYEVAQRQNPAHQNSLYNLGTLHLESLHQPQKAAGFFREYLRRFPQGEAGPKVRELLAQAEGSTAGPR